MSPKVRADIIGGPKGFRTQFRELQDPLSDSDKKYYLCRYTGLSYISILRIFGECSGNVTCIVKRLRIRFNAFYCDDGYWKTLAEWIRYFVPEWQREFQRTMNELVSGNQQELIAPAARALGIPEEALQYIAANQSKIQEFLDGNRSLLGTLAEARLWQLVSEGDAPTVRWLLSRLKPEIYSDKIAKEGSVPDTIQTIEIVDRKRDVPV